LSYSTIEFQSNQYWTEFLTASDTDIGGLGLFIVLIGPKLIVLLISGAGSMFDKPINLLSMLLRFELIPKKDT